FGGTQRGRQQREFRHETRERRQADDQQRAGKEAQAQEGHGGGQRHAHRLAAQVGGIGVFAFEGFLRDREHVGAEALAAFRQLQQQEQGAQRSEERRGGKER